MLGEDFSRVGWPACGEIDVMENIGRESAVIHGTLHGPGFSGARGISSKVSVKGGHRFSDRFHIYGIEWSPGSIAFFLDGREYATITSTSIPDGGHWVFDHPFFLLLNLAIGGDWPGSPDSSTRFPATMLVDWVRVWARMPNESQRRRARVDPSRDHSDAPGSQSDGRN